MNDTLFKQREELQRLWFDGIIELATGPDDMDDQAVIETYERFTKLQYLLENGGRTFVFCQSHSHFLDWLNWIYDKGLTGSLLPDQVKNRFMYPQNEYLTYWPYSNVIVLDSWKIRYESLTPGPKRSWDLRLETMIGNQHQLDVSLLARH